VVLKRVKNLVLDVIQGYIHSQSDLAIQLDITNACNLRCSHCYHSHHDNSGALDINGWLNVLGQYESLLTKLRLEPKIIICGGEPLFSPLLRPIIEAVEAKFPRVSISILSNGTLVKSVTAQHLSQFNINVQISLDGPNAESHDKIRGKGSFQRALRGIRELKSHRIDVYSLAVLSLNTLPFIPDFFTVAKAEGLSSMNFTRFIPQGNGAKLTNIGDDRMLTPRELKLAFEAILSHSQATGVKTHTSSPLYHLIEGANGGHAKFGFQGLVIDYKGRLKVSSRADYVLGDILTQGLEALFLKHPVMQDLRNGAIEVCGSCVHYKHCGGDRNVAYATSGSFLGPDPQCWYVFGEASQ
jgi:MoaA/NifB/PqqE/SkfB family radical SAM enzyme